MIIKEMDSYLQSQSDIYGPPIIKAYQAPISTVYGPPTGRKISCSIVIIVIGVLLTGIITWLFGDCSNINHPTVYGPPPIDTIQIVSPTGHEQ